MGCFLKTVDSVALIPFSQATGRANTTWAMTWPESFRNNIPTLSIKADVFPLDLDHPRSSRFRMKYGCPCYQLELSPPSTKLHPPLLAILHRFGPSVTIFQRQKGIHVRWHPKGLIHPSGQFEVRQRQRTSKRLEVLRCHEMSIFEIWPENRDMWRYM